MRDIKFRAKNIYSGQWVYGSGIVPAIKYSHEISRCKMIIAVDCEGYLPSYTFADIDIETLGQYTGLKDGYGNEIYEGDILRFYGNEIEDWVVSFEDGKFVATFDNEIVDLFEIHNYEIVGSIYDN